MARVVSSPGNAERSEPTSERSQFRGSLTVRVRKPVMVALHEMTDSKAQMRAECFPVCAESAGVGPT